MMDNNPNHMNDAADARRWRYARQFLARDDIENWALLTADGHIPSDDGNRIADEAADEAIARSSA